MVILVGPSGCGKTTSLKMINRLIEPTDGTISIDDRDTRTYDVNDLRRSIGYVIQQVGLFPHQTVAENVATVPRLLGWPKAADPGAGGRAARPDRAAGGRLCAPAARASSAGESASASGWPVRWGPIPTSCSWTSRSARSIRSPASGCRTSCCACRASCARRSSSSPTTSTRRSSSATGWRSSRRAGVLEQFTSPEELLAHPQSAFVTGFLGEGPLVRRLALIPISEVQLTPVNGSTPGGSVDARGTLRDALDAVLRSPDGRVGVTQRRPDARRPGRGRDPRRIDEGALDAASAQVDAASAPVCGADLGRDRDSPVDRRLSDAHRQDLRFGDPQRAEPIQRDDPARLHLGDLVRAGGRDRRAAGCAHRPGGQCRADPGVHAREPRTGGARNRPPGAALRDLSASGSCLPSSRS